MKIRVTRTDTRLGIKKNEIYDAITYPLDPGKVILTNRIPDGYEPMCTQYRDEIEILNEK